MGRSNRVVVLPAAEPLDIDQVRRQVRQVEGVDDTTLTEMITRVRAQVESYLHRALITQDRELVLDAFPASASCCIEIDFGPVQQVLSLKYLDEDDAEQTESLGDYDVDLYSVPARIRPKRANTWPDLQSGLNRVRVRYRAGYGDTAAAIPRDIVQGMLFTLAHLYEHREGVLVGAAPVELPMGVAHFLLPHVVHGH